ncbi:hypothetical protein [Dehalobacter restrictus]|uniref:DUF4304 domain-containing protein n=1 Tax=Dehalobacter restrictus (strain DSM 9455 / PER-K23) TaxID=871738 RepID=A0ABM5P8Y0_DEHRP|nr:hypothetical protein [Dehalobacter restrictus]AHF11241.1 hypothetical protein DEHRE_02275 [Dehalobacter restrictus DSM 9455]
MNQELINKKNVYGLIKKAFTDFAKENGFTFLKNGILVRIRGDILHTIYFDLGLSGLACDIAIQPLYVPSENIVLSFGNRISKFKVNMSERWPYGKTEHQLEQTLKEIKELLEKNALNWFQETGTPRGIVEFIQAGYADDQSLILGLPKFVKKQYLAFSYLYQNELELGTQELRNLEQVLVDDSRPWAVGIKELSKNMRELIINCPDLVEKTLKQFVLKTRQNLKLQSI